MKSPEKNPHIIAKAWDDFSSTMPGKPSAAARKLFFLGAYTAIAKTQAAAKAGDQQAVAHIMAELKAFFELEVSQPEPPTPSIILPH